MFNIKKSSFVLIFGFEICAFFMVLEIFSYSIGDFVSGSNSKLLVSSLVKLRILSKCSSFVAYCWDFLCHFGTGLHLQSLSFLYSYFVLQSSKWPLRKHLPLRHSPSDPRQTDLSLLVMSSFHHKFTHYENISRIFHQFH
jgi:hypothetical protein